MRSFYLLISLILIVGLTACSEEEVMIPPTFSTIVAIGTSGSTTILTAPSQDLSVTISGNINDFAATITASSTGIGEVSLPVNSSDGSWSLTFAPVEGANSVSFAASDQRGNINQLILTVLHDTTAPLVTAVTQSLADPVAPKLVVTFNEALLASSVTTDPFAVNGAPHLGAILDAVPTNLTVTLPLSAALPAGIYRLTCSGITDLATPAGNSVLIDYFFDFTIE